MIKLRAGEISFWQQTYISRLSHPSAGSFDASNAADQAVRSLRERLTTEPSPDQGRKFEPAQ